MMSRSCTSITEYAGGGLQRHSCRCSTQRSQMIDWNNRLLNFPCLPALKFGLALVLSICHGKCLKSVMCCPQPPHLHFLAVQKRSDLFQIGTISNQYACSQDNLMDEVADVDTVPNVKSQHEVTAALSNSFGFGGHNSVVCFAPYKE